jgi:hypothetical protein
MSEYQYYEFMAVDRSLDEQQLEEVRALSTRAHITPRSFVNTYEWGDFRGNPSRLMETQFDAFLYLANWNTRRLMIRLPRQLLDIETAQRYCVGESAAAFVSGECVILAWPWCCSGRLWRWPHPDGRPCRARVPGPDRTGWRA